MFAGLASGLGGGVLVLGQISISGYEMGHVGLKGIIAIAAVIFGGWTLRGTIIGCLLFGYFFALQHAPRARPPHQRPVGRQPSLRRRPGDHRGLRQQLPAPRPRPTLRPRPDMTGRAARGGPCPNPHRTAGRADVCARIRTERAGAVAPCPNPHRTWAGRYVCPSPDRTGGALESAGVGGVDVAAGDDDPVDRALDAVGEEAACLVGGEDQVVELVERKRGPMIAAVIVGSSRTKASASCFSVSPASMAT